MTKTTYTTIFSGGLAKPDPGPQRPVGPGPRRPTRPSPGRGPGRRPSRPSDPRPRPSPPSRPSPTPSPPPGRPLPPVRPVGPLPRRPPLPGWIRGAARYGPWAQYYDYWQFAVTGVRFVRGFAQGGWKHGPNMVPSQPCYGVPPEVVGRVSGCWGITSHPGADAPDPWNGIGRQYTMWGKAVSQYPTNAGQERWYPSQTWSLPGLGPPPFDIRPVQLPGVSFEPFSPSFPPRPPYRDQPNVGTRPSPRPRPQERPTEPTGPERKVQVSRELMMAWHMAMEWLELGDMVNAFWETLPRELRLQTQRTGRVSQSGMRPGLAYSTDYDKAMLLLRHWGTFSAAQMRAGLTAVMLNEIYDQIWGRINAGYDRARDRAGGTGWGFLPGG